MDVDPVAYALADPLPVLLAWVRNHPIVVEQLGGPEYISGSLRDPYPHVVLSPGNGGLPGDGFLHQRPEILVEAFAGPDGTPGKSELRRLLVVVTGVLCAYPSEGLVSSRSVITNVQVSSPFVFRPDLRASTTASGDQTGGQVSWRTTLQVTAKAVPGQG